jgi:cytochrome P450
MLRKIGHEELTVLQSRSRSPYLQAVINETLRVYPMIFGLLLRTAMRDSMVAGVPIPKVLRRRCLEFELSPLTSRLRLS